MWVQIGPDRYASAQEVTFEQRPTVGLIARVRIGTHQVILLTGDEAAALREQLRPVSYDRLARPPRKVAA